MRRYDLEQQEWERRQAERREGRVLPPRTSGGKSWHHVEGRQLVRELVLLAKVTGDVRFCLALTALNDLGLVDDDSNWIRSWRPHDLQRDADELDEMTAWVVEGFVRNGHPATTAFGMVANGLDLQGPSFSAVVRRVERLWKKYKRAGLLEGEYPVERFDTMSGVDV